MSVAQRIGLRLAATHAAGEAAGAVDLMYTAGGGSSIYDSSPLQRRLRDVRVATQHMMIGPPTLELTGRILLGLPTDLRSSESAAARRSLSVEPGPTPQRRSSMSTTTEDP